MTHLAVAMTAPRPEDLARDLEQALAEGATLIEYRLDLLADPGCQLPLRPTSVPVIATCRPVWEGGRFAGSETERRRILLAQAEALQADWIDFEWNAFRKEPLQDWERLRGRVILSCHDFEKTPADLDAIGRQMEALGPAKVKIAGLALDISDNDRMLRWVSESPEPLGRIGLCMGEVGRASRLLAPRFGAFLTFAAVRSGAESAPGQPSIRELLEAYPAWGRSG
jgi:3-dehydroquinate dehydratase / shikimate dehydrogenase